MSIDHFFRMLMSALLLSPVLVVGCGAGPPAGGGPRVGEVVLRLEVIPPLVKCFRVLATGSTRTEVYDFPVQAGPVGEGFRVQRLPLGEVGFQGFAHDVACAAVTETTAAEWMSAVVKVPVARGVVADVMLAMVRNGRANVTGTFREDELCLPERAACASDGDCCSGSCTAGSCVAAACTRTNVALNTQGAAFPTAAESDDGWGGGTSKADLLDGQVAYGLWARGLAYCGGPKGWCGQACGWRQSTVDFGAPRRLTGGVRVYHHGDEHVPRAARVELLAADGVTWNQVFTTGEAQRYLREDLRTPPDAGYGSVPTDYPFPAATTRKVRVWHDNCLGMGDHHGWQYEISVEGCAAQ